MELVKENVCDKLVYLTYDGINQEISDMNWEQGAIKLRLCHSMVAVKLHAYPSDLLNQRKKKKI